MDIRPIDANELEALFNKQIELGSTDAFAAFDDALQDTPTLSLNTLRDAIYQDAVAHGLWEGENNVQGWPDQEGIVDDIGLDKQIAMDEMLEEKDDDGE